MKRTPGEWWSRAGVFLLGVPLVVGLVLGAPVWLFGGVFGLALLVAAGEVRSLAARRASPAFLWSSILGPVIVLLLGAHVLGIRILLGSAWVLLLFAVSWGGDTGAYLVGRTIGRTPLASRISPRKTVEGSVASLVVALALAFLVRGLLLPDLPPGLLALAALGGNLFSQTGDLLESAYKRSFGAKDSGALLGAQGGILDSLDGTLLAAPWMLWMGLAGS